MFMSIYRVEWTYRHLIQQRYYERIADLLTPESEQKLNIETNGVGKWI